MSESKSLPPFSVPLFLGLLVTCKTFFPCLFYFIQVVQSEMIGHINNYLKLLHNWLSQAGFSTNRWVPCYRATLHGWSSKTFHERCTQEGPSVVLVRKSSYVFGGFSDISWNLGKTGVGRLLISQLLARTEEIIILFPPSFYNNILYGC